MTGKFFYFFIQAESTQKGIETFRSSKIMIAKNNHSLFLITGFPEFWQNSFLTTP